MGAPCPWAAPASPGAAEVSCLSWGGFLALSPGGVSFCDSEVAFFGVTVPLRELWMDSKDCAWSSCRVRVGSTLSPPWRQCSAAGLWRDSRVLLGRSFKAVTIWGPRCVLWQSVSAVNPSFPVPFPVPCPGDPVHHPVGRVRRAGLAQLCAEVTGAGAALQEMRQSVKKEPPE